MFGWVKAGLLLCWQQRRISAGHRPHYPRLPHVFLVCSQQNLSNLAWAYAKLAHLDEELMTAIAGRHKGVENTCMQAPARCQAVLVSAGSAAAVCAAAHGCRLVVPATHTAALLAPHAPSQTAPRRWPGSCRCST